MRRVILFFVVMVVCMVRLDAQVSNALDLEYAQLCMQDSIAPGNVVIFTRYVHLNSGETFDRNADQTAYTVSGTATLCDQQLQGESECWRAVTEIQVCDYAARISTDIYSINTDLGKLDLDYPYNPTDTVELEKLIGDITALSTGNGFQLDTITYDGNFISFIGIGLEIFTIGRKLSTGNIGTISPETVTNCASVFTDRNYTVFRNSTGQISLVFDYQGNPVSLPAGAYKVPCCSTCQEEPACRTKGIGFQTTVDSADGTVTFGHYQYNSFSAAIETGKVSITTRTPEGNETTILYSAGTTVNWHHPDPCNYLGTLYQVQTFNGKAIITTIQ